MPANNTFIDCNHTRNLETSHSATYRLPSRRNILNLSTGYMQMILKTKRERFLRSLQRTTTLESTHYCIQPFSSHPQVDNLPPLMIEVLRTL